MTEAEKITRWLDRFAKIHGIDHDVWYDITGDIALTYKKMEKIKKAVEDYKERDQACVSICQIQSIVDGHDSGL